MKLDYSIESPQERKKLVEEILASGEDFSPSYLEALADYLVLCLTKQEKKEKTILTENRMSTISKREPISLENLREIPEESDSTKYAIFHPKISITKEDLASIPYLAQIKESIAFLEAKQKKASGKEAYLIKKSIIELRKDQYLIKQSFQRPVKLLGNFPSYFPTPINDESYITRGKEIVIKGVSLMDTKVISAILCNYSRLKEDSYDQFKGDIWYLIQSFEDICDRALENYPHYQLIVEMKIDSKQNKEIQESLKEKFDISYTVEYISNLWRKRIPKLIAQTAREDFLIAEYKKHNYPMKQCGKCGKTKPANRQFFSHNGGSKDGWYSICKDCRGKKNKIFKKRVNNE